jgi:hypothetical protein
MLSVADDNDKLKGVQVMDLKRMIERRDDEATTANSGRSMLLT